MTKFIIVPETDKMKIYQQNKINKEVSRQINHASRLSIPSMP